MPLFTKSQFCEDEMDDGDNNAVDIDNGDDAASNNSFFYVRGSSVSLSLGYFG